MRRSNEKQIGRNISTDVIFQNKRSSWSGQLFFAVGHLPCFSLFDTSTKSNTVFIWKHVNPIEIGNKGSTWKKCHFMFGVHHSRTFVFAWFLPAARTILMEMLCTVKVSHHVFSTMCTFMQHFVTLKEALSYFKHLGARKSLLRRRYSYFEEGCSYSSSGGGFSHALRPATACIRRKCEEKLSSGDSNFSTPPPLLLRQISTSCYTTTDILSRSARKCWLCTTPISQ